MGIAHRTLLLGLFAAALAVSASSAPPDATASARHGSRCIQLGHKAPAPRRHCRRHAPRPAVQVGRDGTVSLRAALRAFEATFGIVPGTGKRVRADPRFRSGSGPLRWILAHRRRLSKAQLRTVLKVAGERGPGPARAAGPPEGAADEWYDLATEAATRIEAHLGQPLGLALQVTTTDQVSEDAAATVVYDDKFGLEGTPAYCDITVYPSGLKSDLAARRAIAAHEVFHCYEGKLVGLKAYYSPIKSPWRVEGLAEWVGATIGEEWTPGWSGEGYGVGWWKDYLNTPTLSLFQRSYDAIGFYAHLRETGIDPWLRATVILAADGSSAAFAKAVKNNADAVLDSWPSSLALHPQWGAKWTTVGPAMGNPNAAPISYVEIKPGVSRGVVAPARANALLAASIQAPVVALKVKPGGAAHGVLRDGNGYEYPLRDGTLCIYPEGGGGLITIALNGGAVASTVTLTGRKDTDGDCGALRSTALSIVSPSGEFPGRAITSPGQCFLSSKRADGSRAWVLNFDGFQIAAPALAGPGDYTLRGALNQDPDSPYANASTAGVGPWYTLAVPFAGAGHFVVDKGLQSGTVDAIFWAPGEPPIAGPLTVKGTWSCEVQSGPFPGLPIGKA
jgi:hypothetical protein